MRNFIVLSVLCLFLVIGFFAYKAVPQYVVRDIKGWIFKNRVNQMFKDNQILINRVLVLCENTDGEHKVVDKSDQIALDGNLWIENYGNIVFNRESDNLKMDDAWKNKIINQIKPIKRECFQLKNKYKNVIDQKSQKISGVDEKLIGYTLRELWGEVFWALGSSLATDLNDYRRKKKVLVMTTIALHFPWHELEEYLQDRILLASLESGEFKKHVQGEKQANSHAAE